MLAAANTTSLSSAWAGAERPKATSSARISRVINISMRRRIRLNMAAPTPACRAGKRSRRLAPGETSPHTAEPPDRRESALPAIARTVSASVQAEAQVAGWTKDYAPLPGIPDEFIGPDGARREPWTALLKRLAMSPPEAVAERFAAADRRVRNRGMSYRVRGRDFGARLADRAAAAADPDGGMAPDRGRRRPARRTASSACSPTSTATAS